MPSRLRVFTVDGGEAPRVLAFYAANPDPHMMPRDLAALQNMAAERSLYAVEDENANVVGVAYVHTDAAETHREFGGIYFDRILRGSGVPLDFCALVLGTVIASTSSNFVDVIAHTHVANAKPHRLLGELGLAPTSKNDRLLAANFPTMRASIDGMIWGVIHRYLKPHLASSLARRIRAFAGTMGTPGVPTDIGLSDDWDKDDVADALEILAHHP